MGSYNIHIPPRAEKDMRGIAAHITNELGQPDTARKIITALKEGISSLREMPERYAKVADKRLAKKGIRRLIVGNYLVFFTIDEPRRAVRIIGVLYGRRDWKNIL